MIISAAAAGDEVITGQGPARTPHRDMMLTPGLSTLGLIAYASILTLSLSSVEQTTNCRSVRIFEGQINQLI